MTLWNLAPEKLKFKSRLHYFLLFGVGEIIKGHIMLGSVFDLARDGCFKKVDRALLIQEGLVFS